MEQTDSQQPRPSGDLPPLVAAAHRLLQEYAKLPHPTADELLDALLDGSQHTPPRQLNPSTLTPQQQEGWACVRCGRTQTLDIAMQPVGMFHGRRLFACSPTCSTP
ncbi:hypothetical protein [Streptosporangium canum]|uniref:hypothetical protein n=1 Tax=Streptosporangium canum TaxID=324952 RepID=UPI0033A4B9A0